MEGFLNVLIFIIAIGVTIASQVAKANQKKEEQAKRTRSVTRSTPATRPITQPAARPVAQPAARPAYQPVAARTVMPEATSNDYDSLEDDYNAEESVRIAQPLSALRSTIEPVSESPIGSDADETPTTLCEILGGEFDLRRAIVEAEILTPRYAAAS
jgi:hypothetical protein